MLLLFPNSFLTFRLSLLQYLDYWFHRSQENNFVVIRMLSNSIFTLLNNGEQWSTNSFIFILLKKKEPPGEGEESQTMRIPAEGTANECKGPGVEASLAWWRSKKQANVT
jgi:hypothetical protein